MGEYIGTIFVAIVAFVLGYVLGKIVERRKDYSMPEDTVLFNKGVEEGRRLEREEGYSFEFQVDYGFGNYISDTSTSTKKCTVQFPLPANIVNGDKVIIQIKKKEEQK